jgi:predicted protein tyrosine phosphatase
MVKTQSEKVALVPFRATICGIDELADHCASGVTHVLSILDPSTPQPPAFGSFGARTHLELRFDDVIEESSDQVVPRRQHVERILAFGRDLIATVGTDTHLLAHCHAGVSRSTAAMTLILAQACPDRSGGDVINEVLRIRPRAWPNLRIIEFGDGLLGRNGDLVASVVIAYRAQLRLRPELEQIFIDGGRGREVQKVRSEH